MTPIEFIAAAHVAATLIVGGIHAWLIVLGLRAMRRASDSRDRALAAQQHAADQHHAEAQHAADQRHAEAQRAADQRHAEAQRTADQRHAEAMTALRALIARTAPAADAD